MKSTLAVVIVILVPLQCGAQNMAAKALFDCVQKSIPVRVVPPQPTQTAGTWVLMCNGYEAAALFSEMRGYAEDEKSHDGFVTRRTGSGLSCSR